MNTTDITSEKWRVYRTTNIPGTTFIENLETRESKIVTDVNIREIQTCHERVFDRKCQEAFSSGKWPS